MKLLLTSNGFTTEEIIATAEKLCGKNRKEISVALISHSYAVEDGDKRWVIKEMNNVAKTFGGKIEWIDLLALPKEEALRRAQTCDLIYTTGGHTDYLMHVFNSSGFTQSLEFLLKDKLYVGSSASSIIAGARIRTPEFLNYFDEGETYDIVRYLDYVDFAFKPHLYSEDFPGRTEEMFIDATRNYEGTFYGLKDDQAIVVNGDEITFLGGKIFTV